MKDKNYRNVTGIVIGVFIITALYFFAAGRNNSNWPKGRIEADSGHRMIMGTFARIVAVATDSKTAEDCIEPAFEQLERIEALMSYHKDDSEINKVNRDAYKGPVKVSKLLFEVLQRSIEFSEVSGGAFDITIGALVELRRLAAEANSVPAGAELRQACSRVGYDKLILDSSESSVQFTVAGMKLDLGGIAKGYAIDKAIEAMQGCGAVGGLVDIGGDIRCFGAPPQGKDCWLIGLQDPNQTSEALDTGTTLLILELKDGAVATSGDYRRFNLVDGKKYSHIINSNTGYSVNELASVTIISGSSTESDALATAVSVMGQERGLVMIESMPEVEAILISAGPGFERFQSSGAEKYIRNLSVDLTRTQK